MGDSNSTPTSMQGLSASLIAGIVFAGAAALGLAIVFTVMVLRRHRDRGAKDEEKAHGMMQGRANISWPNPQDARESNARVVRSVSRHNLTPSVILPLPVPPVPAARPRPPKVSSEPALNSSGGPMSSVELLAHHKAAGTMPRPFIPHHTFSQRTPTGEVQAPRSSSASASFSFSHVSIVSPSLRNSFASSLRSSLASSTRGGSDLLRVRHVFAPLLPDELVLRPNEKVTLIQSFGDGWCVVGRKSPFHAPTPGRQNEYLFGQGTASPDVEIGAVPLWVFEKRANGSAKAERPMRTESLGVTLLDQGKIGSGEARDDVISWSNF